MRCTMQVHNAHVMLLKNYRRVNKFSKYRIL